MNKKELLKQAIASRLLGYAGKIGAMGGGRVGQAASGMARGAIIGGALGTGAGAVTGGVGGAASGEGIMSGAARGAWQGGTSGAMGGALAGGLLGGAKTSAGTLPINPTGMLPANSMRTQQAMGLGGLGVGAGTAMYSPLSSLGAGANIPGAVQRQMSMQKQSALKEKIKEKLNG